MFQQDPERLTALAGLMDATQYCSTSAIKAITEMILAFKGPEVSNNVESTEAPQRSVSNKSNKGNKRKEDNQELHGTSETV